MKVGAIFSDYDGTIARIDVPLRSSRVPKRIEEPLRRLGSRIPVAIVTSKDYAFIRPRTSFARAWVCVSGLEIVLSDGTAFPMKRLSGRLLEGLEHAMRYRRQGFALEVKRSLDGRLLGFSVDWRKRRAPPVSFIRTAKKELTEMGLTVVHHAGWPFLDVFGARPDKGKAIGELKRLLKVGGNVLFMGDSAADNSAFEEAELAICIEHDQPLDGLSCRFVVPYSELDHLLHSLADDNLFLDLRALRRK